MPTSPQSAPLHQPAHRQRRQGHGPAGPSPARMSTGGESNNPARNPAAARTLEWADGDAPDGPSSRRSTGSNMVASSSDWSHAAASHHHTAGASSVAAAAPSSGGGVDPPPTSAMHSRLGSDESQYLLGRRPSKGRELFQTLLPPSQQQRVGAPGPAAAHEVPPSWSRPNAPAVGSELADSTSPLLLSHRRSPLVLSGPSATASTTPHHSKRPSLAGQILTPPAGTTPTRSPRTPIGVRASPPASTSAVFPFAAMRGAPPEALLTSMAQYREQPLQQHPPSSSPSSSLMPLSATPSASPSLSIGSSKPRFPSISSASATPTGAGTGTSASTSMIKHSSPMLKAQPSASMGGSVPEFDLGATSEIHQVSSSSSLQPPPSRRPLPPQIVSSTGFAAGSVVQPVPQRSFAIAPSGALPPGAPTTHSNRPLPPRVLAPLEISTRRVFANVTAAVADMAGPPAPPATDTHSPVGAARSMFFPTGSSSSRPSLSSSGGAPSPLLASRGSLGLQSPGHSSSSESSGGGSPPHMPPSLPFAPSPLSTAGGDDASPARAMRADFLTAPQGLTCGDLISSGGTPSSSPSPERSPAMSPAGRSRRVLGDLPPALIGFGAGIMGYEPSPSSSQAEPPPHPEPFAFTSLPGERRVDLDALTSGSRASASSTFVAASVAASSRASDEVDFDLHVEDNAIVPRKWRHKARPAATAAAAAAASAQREPAFHGAVDPAIVESFKSSCSATFGYDLMAASSARSRHRSDDDSASTTPTTGGASSSRSLSLNEADHGDEMTAERDREMQLMDDEFDAQEAPLLAALDFRDAMGESRVSRGSKPGVTALLVQQAIDAGKRSPIGGRRKRRETSSMVMGQALEKHVLLLSSKRAAAASALPELPPSPTPVSPTGLPSPLSPHRVIASSIPAHLKPKLAVTRQVSTSSSHSSSTFSVESPSSAFGSKHFFDSARSSMVGLGSPSTASSSISSSSRSSMVRDLSLGGGIGFSPTPHATSQWESPKSSMMVGLRSNIVHSPAPANTRILGTLSPTMRTRMALPPSATAQQQPPPPPQLHPHPSPSAHASITPAASVPSTT